MFDCPANMNIFAVVGDNCIFRWINFVVVPQYTTIIINAADAMISCRFLRVRRDRDCIVEAPRMNIATPIAALMNNTCAIVCFKAFQLSSRYRLDLTITLLKLSLNQSNQSNNPLTFIT